MREQQNLQPSLVAETELGRLLRLWRAKREMSQLDLAAASGVSSRHIAFVETGRAGVGVDTILRLAEALDVPLRDRNRFLTAAGFAPMYRETGFDTTEAEQVFEALDAFLMNQEPFPATCSTAASTSSPTTRRRTGSTGCSSTPTGSGAAGRAAPPRCCSPSMVTVRGSRTGPRSRAGF